MEGTSQTTPNTHRFDILVKWLGLKDPQKNRAAVTLLCRLGELVTPLLVQEAIKHGIRTKHRIHTRRDPGDRRPNRARRDVRTAILAAAP